MAKLKFALRCLFSLALIGFIARKLDWRDLGTVLGRIDLGWAIPASLVTGLLIVTLAFRWRIFLGQQRIDLPPGKVLSLTWAGQFFNSVLPGSTGGDVFKIYQVCRLAPDRKAAAAASVLVDRFSALIALVVLAAIGFLLEPAPLQALAGERFTRTHLAWLVLAGAIVGTAGLVILLRSHGSGWIGRLRRTMIAALEGLRPNKQTVFALLLAFAIHLGNFMGVYLFARSLQIEISPAQVLTIMPVVLLLVMIPITINGHGLRELLLIAYFTQMQIHVGGQSEIGYREVAVGLSLLLVANDLIWCLPGGLQYLTRFRVRRRPELVASPM